MREPMKNKFGDGCLGQQHNDRPETRKERVDEEEIP
jgi:hypothetical protein